MLSPAHGGEWGGRGRGTDRGKGEEESVDKGPGGMSGPGEIISDELVHFMNMFQLELHSISRDLSVLFRWIQFQ